MILDASGKLLHKGSDTKHNRRVVEILKSNPGASCDGFREHVEKSVLPSMLDEWGDCQEHRDLLHRQALEDLTIRPDAHLIDQAAQLVTCWEVEDYHRTDPNKYADVFWFLDEFRWNLRVILVSATTGGEGELDVMAETLNVLTLQKEAAERADSD